MSNAEANLDHPLVEIACRLLTPDPVSRWSFDDEAASILEQALVSQKHDPELAGAVLGIFHVATDLQQAHGAHAAAGRMFAVLGAVGPKLFSDDATPQELRDLFEAAQRSLGTQNRALPLPHDAKAPKGTIPAHQLAAGAPDPRHKRKR